MLKKNYDISSRGEISRICPRKTLFQHTVGEGGMQLMVVEEGKKNHLRFDKISYNFNIKFQWILVS